MKKLQLQRKKERKRYENYRFNLFDTYKSVYFKIWCLCLSNNPEEWRTVTCTCPSFLKNYICKHVIGMSIRLKYCKPPPEAKNVEIGTKRKRGRPSKARKALLLHRHAKAPDFPPDFPPDLRKKIS